LKRNKYRRVRVGTQSQIDGRGRFLSSFSQSRVIKKPESRRGELAGLEQARGNLLATRPILSIDSIRDLRNGADPRLLVHSRNG